MRRFGYATNWHKVFLRVEGQRVIWRSHVAIDAEGICRKVKGVAVWRGLDRRFGSDDTASTAWSVQYHDRLTDTLRKALGHDSGNDVCEAANAERNNDLYWLRRIGLRVRRQ